MRSLQVGHGRRFVFMVFQRRRGTVKEAGAGENEAFGNRPVDIG